VGVAGRVWLDAGCSTGGFTHCLLLRGASLVHAVDVGYNLLDWRLRQLSRVRLHERTNIMGLESLQPRPQAAVADLSFRSMAGAAARILELVADNELYGLIKPQFERKYFRGGAGDAGLGEFSGVVSDQDTQSILGDVAERLAAEGIRLERLAPAGLRGRTGNQEYNALLRRDRSGQTAEDLAKAGQAIIAALSAQ
jgi:23S rRNA (cytidine1920-2'-O)/16S rRNA (cytidine1409-2'-O)-methyltransferase